MIIVEKQAQARGKQGARYCRSLADYMRGSPAPADEYGLTLAAYMRRDAGASALLAARERVLATGALIGGAAASFDVAQVEIARRLAQRSARAKKPARHLIASFRAGEEPGAADAAQVARVLADELGCGEGVMLWALHGDTDNHHLHLLVVTLDANGRPTPYGHGRSHEAMQRTIARVEHAQGRTPERGSRYIVDANGVRRRDRAPTASRRTPIRTETLRWEQETGLESFARYAQRVLAPVLEEAGSWAEAQAGCAKQGAIVRKAGSGGELQSGDRLYRVKLSGVDRGLSWARLATRWGEWTEPDIAVQPYQPCVLDPMKAAAWAERDEQRAAAHDAVQRRIDRLRAEKSAAVAALGDEVAARRGDIGGLDTSPVAKAGMTAALATIYAARLAALREGYDHRIAAACDLRDEVDTCGSPANIDIAELAGADRSLSLAWCRAAVSPVTLPDFRAVIVGQAVQYWAIAKADRRPAFVERGDRIWINDESDAALIAALTVARSRYGDVAAHGDPAFILRAQRLGRQLDMTVQDGQVVATPPPRPRSPRIEINRAVARAAGAAARTRSVAIAARARDAFERLLDASIEPSVDFPIELPGMPPTAPPGFDAATAKGRGLTLAPPRWPAALRQRDDHGR